MRIEVVITEWAGSAVPISSDIFCFVGKSHAHREATAIIGGADVPGVRCVAQEPRMVCPAEIGAKGSARSSISIVCGDPKTAERTWKKGEVLKIGNLETV